MAGGSRRTGEGDLVDQGMLHQGSASLLPCAVDEIDDTWWEACFFDKFSEDEDTQRSLLGCLEDDRVATC